MKKLFILLMLVMSLAFAGVAQAASSDEIVSYGKQYMGLPYAFNATKIVDGQLIQADCSGYIRFVYGHFGIKLPYGSKNIAKAGQYVPRSELRAGDLVFTDTNKDGVINHISIYIGNDQLLHTYKKGIGVTITKFSGSVYSRTYVTARRVL
ncbi:C40 family peptidase [Paenibacillus sp. Soil724D2]|uniref:C40 family peptidase n=1 Tax=Paenibacillus sp. (strain Soil724D2) TaxID=1736392 RepID=UPI0007152637|nr:NlpC/P60 family protein [Paenibacillus sp. Soil724D2]KRE33458.1 hypothetical protein ASG85_14420 [Paenibacillus sp. Soil724D2]